MKVALDADVCIYAVTRTRWTSAVRARLEAADLVGSVLLPIETLAKPLRVGAHEESAVLLALLRQVRLLEVSLPLAMRATALAADFRLKAVDAIHLATAVEAEADVFLTNNKRDFGDVRVDRLSIEFPEPEA